MANPAYQSVSQTVGQVLYSGQVASTSATTVYTVPALSTVKLATATVCNTTGSAVTVTVALCQAGQTDDGTHDLLSAYSLTANTTLPLGDYLAGALLGEGDFLSVTCSAAGAVDVVLTGALSS